MHKQTAEFLEKQQANPASIANHYLLANDQNKALPFLQQAAETAERDFQQIDAAVLAERIADILDTQGKTDEAFEYLKEVRQLLQSSNLYETVKRIIDHLFFLAQTNTQRAESYHALADYLNFQQGDFVAGEEAALKGLQYADVPQLRADLISDLGAALWLQNRLPEAVECWRETVSINRDIKSINLASSLHNLAVPLRQLGQHGEALELMEQSVTLYRQNGLNEYLAVALNNYAIHLCDFGYVKKSLEPLKEALELQHKMQGIDLRVCDTLLTFGNSQFVLCWFRDALNSFQKAPRNSGEGWSPQKG